MKQLFFFLTILVLLCSCNGVLAYPNENAMQKNNQIATFNASALSAQVIAAVHEAKAEIKEDTTAQEDITDTPAYRLFTLQFNSTKYIDSMGEYEGSFLNFISIDADTTCYFCLPESKRLSAD